MIQRSGGTPLASMAGVERAMFDPSDGDAPEADHGAGGSALALLYLSGSAADVDSTTTRLLAGLTKDVRITTAPTSGERAQ